LARTPISLKRVEIENLRGFTRLDIEFAADSVPYVVIGKNGTCKTTLLRSVAALLGGSSGVAQLFARAGSLSVRGAAVRLKAQFEAGAIVDFDVVIPNGLRPEMSYVPSFADDGAFVCAYGVSRFFSGPDSSASSRYMFEDATATLFNVPKPLTEPELTIRRLQDRLNEPTFGAMWKSLERLIGLSAEQSIRVVSGGGLMIYGPNQAQHEFHSWADGHRITFTWILDFFAQAMKADAFDEQGNICGVLLVDEIEQHLHPSMQLEILPKLQAMLPKCQIIVSTHSPLVALSVPSDHVISLQRQAAGGIVRVPTPDLTGYSAEDVLVHPNLFDAPAETQATESARQVFKAAMIKSSRSEHDSKESQDQLSLASVALAKPSRNRLAAVDPELDAALKQVLAAAKASRL
jgi:ABC-type cobalamin/Fe3+-siderophores transport system ATPase subunit